MNSELKGGKTFWTWALISELQCKKVEVVSFQAKTDEEEKNTAIFYTECCMWKGFTLSNYMLVRNLIGQISPPTRTSLCFSWIFNLFSTCVNLIGNISPYLPHLKNDYSILKLYFFLQNTGEQGSNKDLAVLQWMSLSKYVECIVTAVKGIVRQV